MYEKIFADVREDIFEIIESAHLKLPFSNVGIQMRPKSMINRSEQKIK